MWSVNSKSVYIIELTIPFEENIDWAHKHQLGKYKDLREQCIQNDWTTDIYLPLMSDAKGFIANLTSAYLTKLSLLLVEKWKYIKRYQDQTEVASA